MTARLARAAVLAALVAAALPAAAGASTAQEMGGDQLRYMAAAGETNNATVSRDGAVYRITDPGAPITPMAGCAAVNANEVTCAAAGVQDLFLSLGNMNDRGTISETISRPVESDIRGQAGEDTLNGGPNVENFLSGDDGGDPPATDVPDSIDQSAGDDAMSGGAGDDRIFGDDAPNGADTLIGGPGFDNAEYDGRIGDVRLTADAIADDGESGEGDNVMPDVERLQTGFGDDTVVGSAATNVISTDVGNDILMGEDGADSLFAADGNDAVSGGGGDDSVIPSGGQDAADGGDGDDTLISGEFDDEPDLLAGGPGTDLADYSGAGGAYFLDGAPDDGMFGEGDNAMPDVEDVRGGADDDLLVGNASANQLEGGPGADGLIGLGGADGLLGQRGDDALDGGQDPDLLDGAGGADRLRTRDSGPDQALCGAGVDAVLADSDDAPGADCEQSSSGIAIEGGKVKLKGDAARLGLACPALEGVDCKGKLTLKKGKRTLAAKKVSIPSGESEDVKLKLKGKAAKSLAGDRKIPADASARMTDAAGETATTEEPVKLVRGGKS